MNYAKIYDALITKAIHRTTTGYIERHHIVPKCLGGDDEPTNIVALYPEEHYLAHLLLCKIHPGNKRLLFSALFMTTGQQSNAGRRSNKAYGWLRREYAQSMSGDNNPSRLYPDIVKLAALKRTGQKRTEETRQRMSKAQRGRTFTAETKAKMAEAARNRSPVSLETRAKLKASSSGKIGPWRGKTIPDDVRLKMSLSHQAIQLKDWNSPRANLLAWAKAAQLYELSNLSAVKATLAVGLAERHISTVKRIRAKISSGWNPSADSDWQEFKSKL